MIRGLGLLTVAAARGGALDALEPVALQHTGRRRVSGQHPGAEGRRMLLITGEGAEQRQGVTGQPLAPVRHAA